MTIVEADVPCIACGYNVRGLPTDNRCPECGHDVRASVVAHRAGGLTRHQAQQTYRATWMGVAAIVAMLGAGAVSNQWNTVAPPLALALGLLAWGLAGLIALRLPVLQGSENLRRAAIGFGIAACAMPALFFSLVPLDLGRFWRWWPLMMLPSVLSTIASVLVFVALARVARKARRPDLDRVFRFGAVLCVVVLPLLTFMVPMNRPTYSADFLVRQPPPVAGFAATVGTIAVSFRGEYLLIWRFYVWLLQPTLTVLTVVGLYRLGHAMRKIELFR
ncbi:MAG TPA: hypothetical protein VGN72_06240 [Tepidisphaeraceae bacterium]|jgi:hypothetical protein|nr:hypothetical protein [Tepidisphaeraceae bacterium]